MMMHMPWVLALLMAFLVLLVVGALIGIRVLASRSTPTREGGAVRPEAGSGPRR